MSNRQQKDRGKRGKKNVDLNKNPDSPTDLSVNTSRYHLRSSPSDSLDEFPPLPTKESNKKATGVTPVAPADHLQPPPIPPTNLSVGGDETANNTTSILRGGGLVSNENTSTTNLPPMPPPPKTTVPGSPVSPVSTDEDERHMDTNVLKKIDTIEEATNFLDYQATSPKSHEPKSFADIFKEAEIIRNKGKLRFIPPVFTEIGTKHANIPDELLVKQNEKWLLTLVGCFIGKRPAFPFVKFHAFRLWKKYGLIDVILNDRSFFYFKFDNDLGMQKVLDMRPWLFNDIPILLKKWEVGIEFDKIRPTSIPLWVNFYDLAPVMWDYDVLSHIVSVIGDPIAIDRYTEEMCEKNSGRAAFARVLLKVNAEQDLPPCVEAVVMGQMKKFRVQYYWKPDRCSHCNVFGHKFIDCTYRPKSAEEMEATTVTKTNVIDIIQDDLGFQQPKKRRRRSKKANSTGGIVNPKLKVQYVPKKADNHGDPTGIVHTTTPETTASSNSSRSVMMPPPEVPVTGPSNYHQDQAIVEKSNVSGDADEAGSADPDNINVNNDINVLPDDEEKKKQDLEIQEEVEATMAMGDLLCVDFEGCEARIESIIRSERVKITQQHEYG